MVPSNVCFEGIKRKSPQGGMRSAFDRALDPYCALHSVVLTTLAKEVPMLKPVVVLVFTLVLAGVAILGSNNKMSAFTAPGLMGSVPGNLTDVHKAHMAAGTQDAMKRRSAATRPPPTRPPTKPTNK
jgi:hypothetical protein